MVPVPLTVQPGVRFTCRRCGACCRRRVGVELMPGDRERLAEHDWHGEGERFRRGFLEAGLPPDEPRLRQHGGACIFLDGDGLCLVHKRLGARAKPLLCRVFPLRFGSAPSGIIVTASCECVSLHDSYLTGERIEVSPVLDDLAAAAPHLMVLGRSFILRNTQPPSLGWDAVWAILEDAGGAVVDDAPLVGLPWALARVLRRALGGEVPPTPWEWEGPPDVPFYQCLDFIGEGMTAAAERVGLGLVASGFADLRRYQIWQRRCAHLEEGAVAFVRHVLRSWFYELIPLQLGEVAGGLGASLYLAMAVVIGAIRIAEVERGGAPASAAEVNVVAREASSLCRTVAMRALEERLLAFERLLLDAPRL